MNLSACFVFLVSVYQAKSLLQIFNGLLQTAGANLARLNPCPYQDRPTYRPRSSFDIACLGHQKQQKQAYKPPDHKVTLPNIKPPRGIAPVGYTLPQIVQPNFAVRDTKETESAKLVAEMQEIIDKVMKKMEREADHRPLHADGVFKYDGESEVYEELTQKEDQMTFSQLMKMDKNRKTKKEPNRNLVKQTLLKKEPNRIKFETLKKLTIDPVISAMMKNVDSYQTHSEGNIRGRKERHFKIDAFSSAIVFQNIAD